MVTFTNEEQIKLYDLGLKILKLEILKKWLKYSKQ